MIQSSASRIIIVTLLLGLVFSDLIPRAPLLEQSMFKGDKLAVEIDSLIGLQKAQQPISLSSFGGSTLYGDKSFMRFFIPSTKINYTKRLSDHYMVVITDDRTVHFLRIEGFGKAAKYLTSYRFNIRGRKMEGSYCSDAVLNEARHFVYLACYTLRDESIGNHQYVVTYDLNKMQDISYGSLPETQNQMIRNRMKIFITTTVEDGISEQYLITYDQEDSFNPTPPKDNFYLRVYRNVESRTLKYLTTLTVDDSQLSSLYRVYDFNRAILIEGKSSSSQNLMLSECVINVSSEFVRCFSHPLDTGVVSGLAGVDHHGNYYTVDVQKKTLQIFKINDPNNFPEWESELISNFTIPELSNSGTMVPREYEGNSFLGVLNYNTNANQAAGYTILSLTRNMVTTIKQGQASSIGNTLIFAGTVEDSKSQLGGEYIQFARPNDLSVVVSDKTINDQGILSMRVEDSSKDGIAFSTSAAVNILKSIASPIYIDSSFLPDSIILQQNTPSEILMNLDRIESGNLLSAKISSKSGKIEGKFIVESDLDIDWGGDLEDKDIQSIAFSKDRALVQKFDGYIYFFRCVVKTFDKMTCTLYADMELSYLQNASILDFTDNDDHASFVLCQPEMCQAIVVKDNSLVFKYNLDKHTYDILIETGYKNEPSNMVLFAASSNKVKVYLSKAHRPEKWTLEETIDQSYLGNNIKFCPKQVIKSRYGKSKFTVVNDCQGDYQLALEFEYNKNTGKHVLIGQVSFPLNLSRIKVCDSQYGYFAASLYTETELIYVSKEDGMGIQYAPDKVLGNKGTFRYFIMNCLSDERIAISAYLISDNFLTTTILANGGQQRRYISEYIASTSSVVSFDSIAGTIHCSRDELDSFTYRITLEQPRLILKATSVPSTDTNDEVTIKFQNDDGLGISNEQIIRRNVVIRA